mmetsp:Transcript_25926/g.59911  ORF Transcript_25926/g.59911 Transcript_25926/m.59911 type:complete len:163 (-) Transcript_25926:131-619(-)
MARSVLLRVTALLLWSLSAVEVARTAFATPGRPAPHRALRGTGHSESFQGRRSSRISMADGPDQAIMATGAAIFAGLGFGIFMGQVSNIISQDNENLSESLQLSLSADAGMEDVEDTAGDNAKQEEMVEAMARAQGLSEEEIKKLKQQREKTVSANKEDDGW